MRTTSSRDTPRVRLTDPKRTSSSHDATSSVPAKGKKAKVIRDSFTMPETEYALIAEIKKRCLANGVAAKKSEILRAAVTGFAGQSDAYIKAAIAALPAVPTGRPPNDKK